MSPGSRRVMSTGHPSNRNRRIKPNHMLVHLHLIIRVSNMVKIPELNVHIHRVVLLKGVVKLLSAPSVEETSPVFAMRALVVVSSVIGPCIS